LFEIEQLRSAFKKILGLSVWLYLIRNYDHIATGLVASFVQAGMLLAGSNADPRVILNPSQILSTGFDVTSGIGGDMLLTTVLDPLNALSYVASYILILVAFCVLALNVFLALLDYYLALVAGSILIPFVIFAPTRWLGMKPVSALVASGVKLMMVAFVMSVCSTVVTQSSFVVKDQTLKDIWVRVCVSVTLALVAWIAPQRFAQGLMSGSAALGGSDATAAFVGAVRTIAGAATGAGALAPLAQHAGQYAALAGNAALAPFKGASGASAASAPSGAAGARAAAGSPPVGGPAASMLLASASKASASSRPPVLGADSNATNSREGDAS
jgi:type IV secretion system protein TrbL